MLAGSAGVSVFDFTTFLFCLTVVLDADHALPRDLIFATLILHAALFSAVFTMSYRFMSPMSISKSPSHLHSWM